MRSQKFSSHCVNLFFLHYCSPRNRNDNILSLSLSMMTPSNGNTSALLALCRGNSPVTGGFRSQRPVTRSFDVFCDLRLNKLLSKLSRRSWFETPSRSLWRRCNALCMHVRLYFYVQRAVPLYCKYRWSFILANLNLAGGFDRMLI